MAVPYQQAGLTLSEAGPNDPALVRALQQDLRALGYLLRGIDGRFGSGTTRAVRALQWDLLNNDGSSSAADGAAPLPLTTFNQAPDGAPAVARVDGVVDEALAGCIDALLGDPRMTVLPSVDDPAARNREALAAIVATANSKAPPPFIGAMVIQESGGLHYNLPRPRDDDSFVTVGLDRNNRGDPDQITSRGYGIGQYTLFHHPPRREELQDAIVDPVRNVQKMFADLREKFDRFVAGPADVASERRVEHPLLPLRLCRYAPSDARYLRDCRNCARAARKIDIERGTPAYAGAAFGYLPDQYYPSAAYSDVPDRADFLCDWPYAVRRYNGSGNDSFHYQTRVLLNLLGPRVANGE